MVVCAFFTANVGVYPAINQLRLQSFAEKKMIQSEAVVALVAISPVRPESVDARVRSTLRRQPVRLLLNILFSAEKPADSGLF